MSSTRREIVQFTVKSLRQVFREGRSWLVQEGLPEDAKVVDAGYDHARQLFYLTIEHREASPVDEGMEIPQRILAMKLLDEDGEE